MKHAAKNTATEIREPDATPAGSPGNDNNASVLPLEAGPALPPEPSDGSDAGVTHLPANDDGRERPLPPADGAPEAGAVSIGTGEALSAKPPILFGSRTRIIRLRADRKAKVPVKERRGVIYARFSAEGRNMTSIDRQIELAKAYAERNGIKIVAIFRDDACTGATTHGRRGLAEMLEMVQAGECTDVIIEMIDRLSRDQHDLHGIRKRLERAEVALHESTAGVVDGTNLTFKGLMSETQRIQLLFRTSKGRDMAVAMGRSPHRVTFGLMRDPYRPGVRIPHPERGAIVARMYASAAEGASFAAIAAGLSGKVPTPGDSTLIDQGRLPKETCADWTPNMVRGVLRNPANMGLLVDRMTETIRDPETWQKGPRRLRPEEEWSIVEVPGQALVSAERWHEVQARLDRRYFNGVKTREWSRYLLTGLVHCKCGAPARVQALGGAPAFKCGGPRSCGGFGFLRIPWVEGPLLEILRDEILSDDVVEHFRAGYLGRAAERIAAWERRRDHLRDEAARLSALLDRSFEDGLLDGFATERAATYRAGLEASLRGVEIELRDLRKPAEVDPDRLRTLREGIGEVIARVPFRGADESSTLLRDDILSVVSRLTVSRAEDGTAEVEAVFDLGGLVGEVDAPPLSRSFVIDTVARGAADRAAAAATRRKRRDDDYAAAGGDLTDDAWARIAAKAAIAEPSVTAFGWTCRSLIDSIRYRSLVGVVSELPPRFGPAERHTAASRVLVRSGAFTAIAAELAGTPFEIQRPERFMPWIVRPTAAAAAERAGLAAREGDDERVRIHLAVAAMRADGLPRAACVRRYGLRRDEVEDVFLVYASLGAAGLRGGCTPAARGGATAPSTTSSLDRSPLLEAKLIAMSLLDGGMSVREAAAATGLGVDGIRAARRAFAADGVSALRSHSWSLREAGFVPGPAATSDADALDGFLPGSDGPQRARLTAFIRYLRGRPRSEVLATGIDLVAFKSCAHVYRVHGVEGLRPGSGPAGRRLREEAAAVDGVIRDRKLALARFLEGDDYVGVAAALGCTAGFVEATVRQWVANGAVCRARGESVPTTLEPHEVAALKAICEAGLDPDHPDRPLSMRVLRRLCRDRFGLVMCDASARRTFGRYGLEIRPPAVPLNRRGSRARIVATAYRAASRGA